MDRIISISCICKTFFEDYKNDNRERPKNTNTTGKLTKNHCYEAISQVVVPSKGENRQKVANGQISCNKHIHNRVCFIGRVIETMQNLL